MQNRSLFLDESNLARNIVEGSIADFFAPLELLHAPPLFLVIEKINYLLFGTSEWALRLWPILMGCLAFYFFYRLIQDFSDQSIPLLFVLYLFTFSAVYVRYASELKQYSTDMAVATFLLWAALKWPILHPKSALIWIPLGSLSIWLSMPAVFVLAGIGCYFLYQQFKNDRLEHWGALLSTGGIWLLQFGLYYYLILGNDLQTTSLTDYHQSHFWPLLPNEWLEWKQLGNLSASLLTTLIGHTIIAQIIGVLGLALGVYSLWTGERAKLVLLLFPVLLCLLASGLGLYSLMERLTLFLMPMLGILLLVGLHYIWVSVPSTGKIVLLLALLPIIPLRKAWTHFLRPYQYEEMRPLLQSLQTEIQPGDLIWVDHNANPAFRWYTYYDQQNYTWDQDSTIQYSAWNQLASEEISSIKGQGKTYWLIFSHLVSDQNQWEMQQNLDAMQERYGQPVAALHFPGAMAWKYIVE